MGVESDLCSSGWVFPKTDKQWHSEIVREFQVHPILAEIFVARGFLSLNEIHKFLYAQLPDLYDPGLFADMDSAVTRIATAVKNRERILICGDNDVDGITGTALLVEFFRDLDVRVDYCVSTSILKQQTLSDAVLKDFAENPVDLVITVDYGITAGKEIRKLSDKGIDVIITDHHQPTGQIPHCLATLNPKLIRQTYPNLELTGVGVAFKLAHGVVNHLVSQKIIPPDKIDLKAYLDLVALGTITDLGLLEGENRILVRYGMKCFKNTSRIGLIKLCSLLDLDYSEINTTDIALKVSPRINSLGRVDDPAKGIELLLADDEETTNRLVKELDIVNHMRQQMEHKVLAAAEGMLRDNPRLLNHKAIVLYSSDWHPRLVPIISSRFAKQYNRPVVIIALDESDIGKGSIRTIREFPLLAILKKCKDHFISYGGHDYAAGVVISKKKIESFRKKFIHIADFHLKSQDIVSKLFLDAQVDFKDLDYELMASLELLEPYGNGNSSPVFYCRARQAWLPRIIAKQHLKLFLQQEDRVLEGVAFGRASTFSFLKRHFEGEFAVAYTPNMTSFNKKKSLQLVIKDIRLIT